MAAGSTKDELGNIRELLVGFTEQYFKDMHGDTKVNGDRGIVGALRDIKKTQDDYPSLTYLLAHSPLKTIACILGLYIILEAMFLAGMIGIVARMLGIDVSVF